MPAPEGMICGSSSAAWVEAAVSEGGQTETGLSQCTGFSDFI